MKCQSGYVCRPALLAFLLLTAGNVTAFSAEQQTPAATACTLEPGEVRTVARIIDGETVRLDDGSDVRLIGALAPRASDTGASPGAWPAENDAVEILSDMVLGKSVKLAYGGRKYDRYGRHLAQLFFNDAGSEKWVQGELLAAGAARAYGLPGSFACSTELLAHERIARTATVGLWETAIYQPKPARLTALLLSRRSRFEIVTGAVAAASRAKSGIYLNFGNDKKTDFTVRVGKDVLAANPDWDRTLDSITGKTVLVRGWIERRNGPMIDVRDPGQLEILDAQTPPSPVSALPMPGDRANAKADAPETGSEAPKNSAADRKENRPLVPQGKPAGDVDL